MPNFAKLQKNGQNIQIFIYSWCVKCLRKATESNSYISMNFPMKIEVLTNASKNKGKSLSKNTGK